MGYENVLLEIEEGVALVKVNRPTALNSLNQAVLLDLIAAFSDLAQDDTVRAIIVTGAGKAFVAGADIKEMLPLSPAEIREFSATGHRLM
ncbi:MAG: enoyl-CoA hydratase/isomerase family protein, partial [Deltaproteobacteria bacterium]|nr:enoyl-CoA hydratase/isomerase family protein [Deltaproteobacteria bacterium]